MKEEEDNAGTSKEIKKKKKSFVIHSQAREMARRIVMMCEEEKRMNQYAFSVNQAFERAAHYTGLSKSVLCKIKREPTDPGGHLEAPSRKGKKYPRRNDLPVDEIDRQVIHRCIEEIYLIKKSIPTCRKLLAEIRETIDFPWGMTSMRKMLKYMGYVWQKCPSKRTILIERPDVVTPRSIYLQNISQFREKGREVFFFGKMWIDFNLTYKKCWRDDKIVLPDKNSSNRLILVHAGSKKGFLEGAKLLFIDSTIGDGRLNCVNFEVWVNELLLPNLPANSVVVITGVPYESLEDALPPEGSSKQVMIDWLTKNKVHANNSMTEEHLYNLIQLHKAPEAFKIEEIIRSQGHDVLRLPPYICDLNPLELAWAKLIRLVKEQHITTDLSLTKLKTITEEALTHVTEEDWRDYDNHAVVLEEYYMRRDYEMEATIGALLAEAARKVGTSFRTSDDNASNSSGGYMSD